MVWGGWGKKRDKYVRYLISGMQGKPSLISLLYLFCSAPISALGTMDKIDEGMYGVVRICWESSSVL